MSFTEKPDISGLNKSQIYNIENLDFDLQKYKAYSVLSGSKAYGLENENSDTDIRGIFFFHHINIYLG